MSRRAISGAPRRLGGWRLLRPLGMGGMGVVYLARRGDTLGALKVIHPALARDPAFRARFAREVDVARRVQSVHVAAVLDADVGATNPWFVSQFVDGPTLEKHVRRWGPLGADQVVELSAVLFSALTDIHAVGVVHRDIKPGNVMLSPRGPVIGDFGVASAADFTAMTGTGNAVGSANWMAPEQLEGHAATSASDVFSAAATTAFASTGRPPFGTGLSALKRIADEAPDLAGVPAELVGSIEQALSADPAARPSADRLTGRLRLRPRGEQTYVATIVSAPDAARPQARRRPRSPLLWGGVASMLVAVAVAAAVFIGGIDAGLPDIQAADPSLGPSPTFNQPIVRASETDTTSGQSTLPLVSTTVNLGDAAQIQALGSTLASRVQSKIRLDLRLWKLRGSFFYLDRRGRYQRHGQFWGGLKCATRYCRRESGITSINIEIDDTSGPNTIFDGVGSMWQISGRFFVQSFTVENGGVYEVHLHSLEAAADYRTRSDSSMREIRQCGVLESRPREYPGVPVSGDGRSSSKDVLVVQDLINFGIVLTAPEKCLDEDGIFGPATRAAVADEQEFWGLPVTGQVDEDLWSLLMTFFEPA